MKITSIIGLGALLLTGAGCLSTSTQPEIDLSDFTQDLENLAIEITTPETITVGDEFTFSVNIANTGEAERSLRSIDIDRAALAGLEIISTNPELQDQYYVDVLEQEIYEFNAPIGAGETRTAEFNARATTAGTYTGDFDVCIDNDINCIFDSIEMTITE